MSVQSAPFDRLFAADRRDASIWHARPRGLHAFGRLAPPASREPATVYEATDTTGSTDDRDRWQQRPPALAHGTIQAILPDAIVFWLEGGGFWREQLRGVDWGWWPTHLAGTWEAPGVRLRLRVAMIDGDDAVVEVTVTNTAAAPLAAELVAQGDDNYITLCRSGVHRYSGEWAFGEPASVIAIKRPELAQEMEYFPYTSVLPADDPKFDFVPTCYQYVFAFDEQFRARRTVAGTDGFERWQLRRAVGLQPGESLTLQVGFAAHWAGRQTVPPEVREALLRRADGARRTPFEEVVEASGRVWRALLAKAPCLQGDWPPEWVDLYYKAWVTVWADLLPPADLGLFTSTHPIVTCLRIGDTLFSNPASWEGSLGALVLALADPQLGGDCLEAVYDTTAEDGYLAEALGSRRGTALACVEPWIAWAIYRRSGDRDFLGRIWHHLRLNLAYKLYQPVFKHGTVFNCRNYAYGNIAAKAALKIARELGRPAGEIAAVEQMISETERIVHAFWDEEQGCHRASLDPNERQGGPSQAFADGTDAATLVALLGVARPGECRRMIDFCRREYLEPNGVLRCYPRQARAATGGHRSHLRSMTEFALKESNHMAVLKGLKDLDRELFERVARGTVANIAIDGDFWECTTLDGQGKHNGPGSIFGAFAVIWALLLLEDRVDDLYD